MRLERAERSDKDARRRLLAYPPAPPTLFERPLLQGPFPPEHVPQTRAAGGAGTSHCEYGAPYGCACVLDARTRLLSKCGAHLAAGHWPRDVERAQRIELRGSKAGAEVLSSLPHTRGIVPRRSIIASVSTARYGRAGLPALSPIARSKRSTVSWRRRSGVGATSAFPSAEIRLGRARLCLIVGRSNK
jgi:hypothetical protein